MSKRIDVDNIKQQAKNGTFVVAKTTLAISEKMLPTDYKRGTCFRFVGGDKTGKIKVTYWGGQDKDKTDKLCQSITNGDVVTLSNVTADTYKGEASLSLNEGKSSLEKICEFDTADFIRVCKRDREEMWAELDGIRNSVMDTNLKKLLEKVFSDGDLKKKIVDSTAAKNAAS